MRHLMITSEWLATPWAMRRDVLANHARLLAHVLAADPGGAGERYAMDDDYAGRPRIGAYEAARQGAQARAGSGAIAVLPIYGTIVQRASMLGMCEGGTGTQDVSQALRAALADDSIGQVLLDIHSPGGSVYGVSELGDEIYQARKTKPIVALANSLAASAAYWLGCQASEFYVTPGGEVGSIGVWLAHEDWSAALAAAGVKTTLISAGKYKTEGNPFEPLADESQAFLQSRVDDYHRAFTKAVSRGRGVGIDAVRSGMGQGRMLGADQALEQQMVDGIETFDGMLRKMQSRGRSQPAGAAGRSALKAAQNELALLG